jgi:hypothetical protein
LSSYRWFIWFAIRDKSSAESHPGRATPAQWGLLSAIPDALLIADELVCNAVDACPLGAEIWISCTRDAAGVLLEVWDPVDRLPEPKTVELTLDTLDLDPANFDRNGGWGLAIVAALSLDHGCNPHPHGGKTAWARLKV